MKTATTDLRSLFVLIFVMAATALVGIACDSGEEGAVCTSDEDCNVDEGLTCSASGTCELAGCSANADCALGETCTEGMCAAAACADDNPCALGATCNAGSCEAGTDQVVTADLGSISVNSDRSDTLTVDVPEGAQSFSVVLDGAGSNLILASLIRSPSGEIVYDWFNDVLTNRTDATDGLYTLMVPTNPSVAVTPGRWRLNFISDGATFNATATAIVKTSAGSNTLDLNLFFVGVDGLDAATAQTDPEFQTLLSNVGSTFGGAGISVGNTSYQDITGADADRLRVIDSYENPGDELYELFALSAGQTNRAINLFFVADIAGSDNTTLLGLSGGIPGPPGLHGTLRSGVAVNMANWIAASPLAREEAELIIAHETGHYMGLFHTTEKNGPSGDGVTGTDPLSDTPECPASADADGSGLFSATECADFGSDNLMFWSPPVTSRGLTANQADILRRNAVVQ